MKALDTQRLRTRAALYGYFQEMFYPGAYLMPPLWLTRLLWEEGKNRWQESISVHHRPSTCASAASPWGSQNVMSIALYSSIAIDNSVRACSR
jgi:hypothetical protein